jgi:CDP-paratose 2-epimerase
MKFFITGGAGFIGCNTAHQLLQEGHEVVVLDNLFRSGSDKNLAWLHEHHDNLVFLHVDIRNAADLNAALAQHADTDVVVHLAAQVAVTTSVVNPREDFDINALGTFNVLEAVRMLQLDPIVLFVSTNKVYGGMEHVSVVEDAQRYRYQDLPQGVPVDTPLDFHSPYGCSKGAADQYVRDYARIYGMRTIVFRNSCIYGQRQFGVEDQGWVAWFCIAAALHRPITIYGDGKQIRDILHVDDLVQAFRLAIARIDTTKGQVYNIGGGPANTLAIWSEFGSILERLAQRSIPVTWGDWRPGDQRVFVADVSKAATDFGWQPTIGVEAGIERLYHWVVENKSLFES